jgi:diaminopimelate epimerase
MTLHFTKYHGLGNDFIFVNNLSNQDLTLTPDQCIFLCNRNFGIGADGVVFVRRAVDNMNDYQMTIINNDGTEAEMCGNATRCLAKYLSELENFKGQKTYHIETLAGIIKPTLNPDGTVTVDMNTPKLDYELIPTTMTKKDRFQIGNKMIEATCVSMGNPHCVIYVDNFDFDWQKVGAEIEVSSFFPKKTNVHFVQVINNDYVKVKVWERGAGATLACGTGACAITVAGILTGKTLNNCSVELPGGVLNISWSGDSKDSVMMAGSATKVFVGEVEI